MFLVPCMRFEHIEVQRIAFTLFRRISAQLNWHSWVYTVSIPLNPMISCFFLFLSLLLILVSTAEVFLCFPLELNGGNGRRLELGPQVSVLTVGSTRYQARQAIQMLGAVKVWEGQTGCQKQPPFVRVNKERYNKLIIITHRFIYHMNRGVTN